ncbi:hypothetical protein LZ32DRAFT_460191 [Colletotrichum eremochloae]|nr:hypothetical protein LZ32DRAFT_460191 [Colletotrichum eremochloae]
MKKKVRRPPDGAKASGTVKARPRPAGQQNPREGWGLRRGQEGCCAQRQCPEMLGAADVPGTGFPANPSTAKAAQAPSFSPCQEESCSQLTVRVRDTVHESLFECRRSGRADAASSIGVVRSWRKRAVWPFRGKCQDRSDRSSAWPVWPRRSKHQEASVARSSAPPYHAAESPVLAPRARATCSLIMLVRQRS